MNKTTTPMYIVYARRMLNLPEKQELPEDLEQRLHYINDLIKVGRNVHDAELRSSQIVAMVVEQWQREQEN